MYITDIKKERKMLSAVYVDGEFWAKIDNEILAQNKIKVGASLDETQLEQLKYDSEYKRAKEKSLYVLSFRDHSKKDLFNKLKKDYSTTVAQDAAARMEELGLINDENFARKFARELLLTKRFSKRRAEIELAQKGISREVICEALDSVNYDPVEQIKILLEKKYKTASTDEKVKKRAVAFLQRYGYSWDEIRRAIDL